MSTKALYWAYRQDLDVRAKFVLVAMANECDGHEFYFASRRYLVYVAGFTELAVAAALVELVEWGCVVSAGRIGTHTGEEMDDVHVLNVDNRFNLVALPVMKPQWDQSCGTTTWDADRARVEGQL